MNSGGGHKEKWGNIFIEAPQTEAISIFFAKFGHNPTRVSCTCCGQDYSISEDKSLAQLTGFHRGCKDTSDGYIEEQATDFCHTKYQPLEEYCKNKCVLIISLDEITDEERNTSVPEQGYVWR